MGLALLLLTTINGAGNECLSCVFHRVGVQLQEEELLLLGELVDGDQRRIRCHRHGDSDHDVDRLC